MGLFEAGPSILSSLLNGMFGAIEGSSSRRWQEEMWNKQNEYNTPKAQIARLREAGLNPAMMYSNGSAGGTSASIPSAPAPTWGNFKFDFRQALQAKRDAQLFDQHLLGLQEDLRLKEELTDTQKLTNDLKRLEYKRKLYGQENGEWEKELRVLDDNHNLNVANVKSITDENKRREAAEQRLQEVHKEWQDNAEMRQALYNAEGELKKSIMANDLTMQEARKNMLSRGFDPNVIKNGNLTFAELQVVIESLLQTERFKMMRHSDRINEVIKVLLPATGLPWVGDFAKSIIDWLEMSKPVAY